MTLSAELIGVEGRHRETGAKAEKSTLEVSCSNPGERGQGLGPGDQQRMWEEQLELGQKRKTGVKADWKGLVLTP